MALTTRVRTLKEAPHFFIGNQVQVTPAVAGFDVFQAVPLFGQGMQAPWPASW